MFRLLKLSALVLLKSHKITDEHSCRRFLIELLLLTKSLAAETKTQVDDVLLKCIEFIVNNDALFKYAYRPMLPQHLTQLKLATLGGNGCYFQHGYIQALSIINMFIQF